MKSLIRAFALAALTVGLTPAIGVAAPASDSSVRESHAAACPKGKVPKVVKGKRVCVFPPCPKGKVAKVVKAKRVCVLPPCPKGKARKKVNGKLICVAIGGGAGAGSGSGTSSKPGPKRFTGTIESVLETSDSTGGKKTTKTTATLTWVSTNPQPLDLIGSYKLDSGTVTVSVSGGLNGCTSSGGGTRTYAAGSLPATLTATDFSFTDFAKWEKPSYPGYDKARPVYFNVALNDQIPGPITTTCPNVTNPTVEQTVFMELRLGQTPHGMFPAEDLNAPAITNIKGTFTKPAGTSTTQTYTWSLTPQY